MFSLLASISLMSFSQEVHHQMISSYGSSVELENGTYISHTFGQLSPIGQKNIDNAQIIQGFQQPNWDSLIATNQINNNEDVTIFPNPVIDYLSVKFSNSETGKLKFLILDIQGKLILKGEIDINSFRSSIDMTQIPKGAYLLYITNENLNLYKKIIKK